jgi:hypothetical protein
VKYDVVGEEEASDRSSTDFWSVYAEEKTEIQRKRQVQGLSTYLFWYSTVSTVVILLLSIALFSASATTSSKTVRPSALCLILFLPVDTDNLTALSRTLSEQTR